MDGGARPGWKSSYPLEILRCKLETSRVLQLLTPGFFLHYDIIVPRISIG